MISFFYTLVSFRKLYGTGAQVIRRYREYKQRNHKRHISKTFPSIVHVHHLICLEVESGVLRPILLSLARVMTPLLDYEYSITSLLYKVYNSF